MRAAADQIVEHTHDVHDVLLLLVSGRGPPIVEIHQLELEVGARLAKCDVRGQGAAARHEVELQHLISL